MIFQNTQFIKSAAKLSQLAEDSIAEIAFAGRSNAGKSTALNTITNKRGLAKTSKTPGRTQLINYFEIKPHYYLVDLPGYGYAKVPESVKKNWQYTLSQYLITRPMLKGLILVIDIRHIDKSTDHEMLHWAGEVQLPTHVLLSKADKLSQQAQKKQISTFLKMIPSRFPLTVQAFSALKHQGLTEAREKILQLIGSDILT